MKRETDFESQLLLRKNIALSALFFFSAVFGALDLFLYYKEGWPQASPVIYAIVGVITIYTWCKYDSAARKQSLSGLLKAGIVFLAIAGVPIYLIRARGWKGAAKIGFGLPVLFVSIAIYYGAWYASAWLASAVRYYQ